MVAELHHSDEKAALPPAGGHDYEKNNTTMTVKEAEIFDAEDIICAEHEFTEAEYKKLRLKIDFIMMPLLMITYGLQYSDKTSLSSGVIFGLREDTNLKGNQYADLSTFFYMAYAIAQLPMGWFMQRVSLGKALSICVIIWGGMVLALGGCNNYAELSVVRVCLGWFEAVVTPGFAMLTSSWYLRREQTLRQNFYYAMNTFFGIVFSIGIYFIALNAQKSGGIAAWRVINFFLGGLTVGMGIVLLVMVGTPDEVWWLSRREKRMAKARIVSNATGGGEQHPWVWSQCIEGLKDRQFWHLILYNFLSCVPNGGLSTFNALVYRSLGFSPLETILYSMPANAIGFTCILATAFTVTRWPKLRFPAAVLFCCVPIIVFLYVGLAPDSVGSWAKYACFSFYGLFAIPTFMIWPLMSVNIAGRTKKSFVGAMSLFSYCIGNIVGTQIFVPSDAPKYIGGLTGCAIALILNACNISFMWLYYLRENRRRDRAFEESGMSVETRDHEMKLAGETDMTDKQNQHFRYSC